MAENLCRFIKMNKEYTAFCKWIVVFLFFSFEIQGQDSEIDRLIDSELKTTFPSIHFKHNSTDYITMPYTVDSCFNI